VSETEESTVTVFDEIVLAVNAAKKGSGNRKKSMDDKTYIENLMEGVSNLDKEDWDGLSEDARNWYNDAVRATQAEEEFEFPEGFAPKDAPPMKKAVAENTASEEEGESETAEDDETQTEDAGEEDAAPAKKTRGRPRGNGKVKEKKEPSERKSRVSPGFTLRTIRRMVVKNPDITVAELQKAAADEGIQYTTGSLQMAVQSTKIVVGIVKETGHWVD
jgi:hypothetical protein